MIVTNKLEECIFSIPSPFDEDKSIDLYVKIDKPTKNKVEFINSSPYITTNVNLSARVLSQSKNSNYFKGDDLEILENYANSYVKNKITNYLYKTAKDYESDIARFGKYAIKYFSTWDEWKKYNWLDNYTNAFFNVNVDVKVLSSYLIS